MMTKYQEENNMMSLETMWYIERLINQKKYKEIIDLFEEDPGYALDVTEGSLYPDYVFSFLPDYNRSEFARRLLSIKTKYGLPVFYLKVILEKGYDNLWHKIWYIEVN